MANLFRKLLVKWFNYKPIKVEAVFTPTTAAVANYIERSELENSIKKSLSTPGKQVVLFGHSGSGKTTVIRSILDSSDIKYVRTQCETATTFNDILYYGFDCLDKFVVVEKSNTIGCTITGKLAAEYGNIKSKLSSEVSEKDSTKQIRIIPPQLTPQKLARFFGEGGLVWVIEDFHKVCEAEKVRIADLLKVFVDNANDYPQTKIICIGARENANDLINLDPNLKNRVDEIKVPMLSDKNIGALIDNGFTLLNLKIEERLRDKLIYYSSRIGSVAHQMCLDICQAKDIYKRQGKSVLLKDSDFTHAVNCYVKSNEGSLSKVYDIAVRDELGWYILKTLSRNSQDRLSFKEIKRIVNSSRMTFTDEQIQGKLNELCTPDLSVLFYSSTSEKYSLSSPFWLAFLRLQFAQEDAEHQKAVNDKKFKQLRLVNQNDRDAYVEKLMIELIDQLRNR